MSQRYSTEVEKLTHTYLTTEVFAVCTSIVEHLLGTDDHLSPITRDDIDYAIPDTENMTPVELNEYLEDELNTGWSTVVGRIVTPDEIEEMDDDHPDVGYVCGFIEENNVERVVYEWWMVSPWMATALREEGQVTIMNASGNFWGRCATGQSLRMDGIFQRIAEKYA